MPDEKPTHDAPAQNVAPREITEELSESYLAYAMSVIVSRALPDIRDGLKPVHRRILFAMWKDLGLRATGPFRKSARVVGDVIGRYHPHGDTAVYHSLVRMAQTWSLRYPLIFPQGNFGSVDGDSPAAMRYTEAKLQKIAEEMLRDLDKKTVDWRGNYDNTSREPVVLPSAIPNMIVNGGQGIAVGMATNIPPANLRETVAATRILLRKRDAEWDEIFEVFKGPDFPTRGVIFDEKAIQKAYMTGQGRVTMRGVMEADDDRIIISELPYQVNKAELVAQIAQLVTDKKITGIRDIRDESAKEEIRVVLELKKDAAPAAIQNHLWKMTPLQSNFNLNMVALDKGIQPKLFNLRSALLAYIDHRMDVTVRRLKFELAQAEARAHILEGLKIALDNIDAVIKTIKESPTQEEARENLMAKFKLSELQANAILEMQLRRLAGLERKKIEDELAEKLALIAEIKGILASEEKLTDLIDTDLAEAADKFGDDRKTRVVRGAVGVLADEDLIADEDALLVLTKAGYIKRLPPDTFRAQKRGGKGVKGLTTRDDDEIQAVVTARTHDQLLFFTDSGKVFKIRAFEVPEGSRTARGTALPNLIQITADDQITALLNLPKEAFAAESETALFFATSHGTVKQTAISEFASVMKNGKIAIKLKEGESLGWVRLATDTDQAVLVSREGMASRFDLTEVRRMGRSAAGVRGMRLKPDDRIIEADVIADPDAATLFTLAENGLGKRSKVADYRQTRRGAGGVKTANLTARTGKLVGARVLPIDFVGDTVMISKGGIVIRSDFAKIPVRGRNTQGVKLMTFKGAEDKVVGFAVVEAVPDEE